jgi:signal transduction histidine kinase
MNEKLLTIHTPEPGDLQRSLQKELSIIGAIAIALLTTWSALNHYYGSYQGGLAWVSGSQKALILAHEERAQNLLDRASSLIRLDHPLEVLKRGEIFFICRRLNGRISVIKQYGLTSPQVNAEVVRWIEALSVHQAKEVGYFFTDDNLWSGGVGHIGEQWGVLLHKIDEKWLSIDTQLTNTEGIIFNESKETLLSSFLPFDESSSKKLIPNLKDFHPTSLSLSDEEKKFDGIGPDYDVLQFSEQYRGTFDLFHVGESQFSAFHAGLPFYSPFGEVKGWMWIFIPEDVMLLWPKRGVIGALLLGITIMMLLIWRTRVKTQAHLAPITSLINEIESLNLSIGGASTLRPSARFQDLNHLRHAISQLKHQLYENLQLEEQLRQSQKMEVVGTLAGGVAHDFNNLLSVLLLNSESLQEDLTRLETSVRTSEDSNQAVKKVRKYILEDGDWAEMLEEMKLACDQAKVLTRQLLSLSRDQGGQSSTFEISRSAQESFKLLQRLIPEKIQLTFNKPDEELWSKGSENALQQVIMNLVINGRDAINEQGLIEVSIRHHTQSVVESLNAGTLKPGDYACLTVQDSGSGISEEHLVHLFEPFFSSKGRKGTGLGLTVVYTTVVRRFQGAIRVQTSLGLGSEFEVYLPVIKGRFGSKEVQLQQLNTPIQGKHIILLEDHELVRKSLILTLSHIGFQVTAFPSGIDFIAWLNKAKIEDGSIVINQDHHPFPSLVLSDVVMPEKSGPEVWREVRETYPNLPFLFLTGYADEMLNKYNVPAHLSLTKPATSDQLYIKICEVLTTHKDKS